jgi:hypothetical protein
MLSNVQMNQVIVSLLKESTVEYMNQWEDGIV